MANEVRQILWPDGDDAISAIDVVHGERSEWGLFSAMRRICAVLLL